MKIKTKSKNRSRLLLLVITCGVIVICLVAYLVYSQYRSTGLEDKSSQDQQTNSQESGGGISSPKTKSNQSASTPNPNIPPIKPSGTFVSNHHPNLSGSPAPNRITSTCTTTPGVLCTVQFTNGGTTKTLPEKTTDSNGNVGWDWTLQEVGLSIGEWQVKAIAKNGDKTTEDLDVIPLIVAE